MNDVHNNEEILKNYIESLKEDNLELRKMLKAAESDGRAANRSARKARKLAHDCLFKLRQERERRKQAEDEAIELDKTTRKTSQLLDEYKLLVENSESTKKRMQKEWRSQEEAHSRGGKKSWPVWVVQLICELLVNGSLPTSIQENIRTWYGTLYGESPNEVPSCNFIRECRVVVEVIGETVAAIKLASAESWKQAWTDATSRRQIPFGALIIGLLGDDESEPIDPVVVSSCIFTEDEKAETQAAGLIDKVCLLIKTPSLNNSSLNTCPCRLTL